MKNISLLSCALLIMAITGCNKHGGSQARIKKMSSSRGFSTEYTYSPDGNVASSKTSDGTKTTYTYKGNTISQQLSDTARGMSISSTIYLNSRGLADSSTAQDQGSPYVKMYIHDADGFITESRDYVGGALMDVYKSTFKDGNQTTVTVADSSLKPSFTAYIDYYADKPNSLSYENFGMKFLGSDSKNLVRKLAQVLPTGDTVRSTSFKYYLDSQGRIGGKATYDDKRNMMVDSTVFTYE